MATCRQTKRSAAPDPETGSPTANCSAQFQRAVKSLPRSRRARCQVHLVTSFDHKAGRRRVEGTIRRASVRLIASAQLQTFFVVRHPALGAPRRALALSAAFRSMGCALLVRLRAGVMPVERRG